MKMTQVDRWFSVQSRESSSATRVAKYLFRTLSFLTVVALSLPNTTFAQTKIAPKEMKVLGEVGPRYVSYNVEAVEVTGGRFWAPFKSLPPNIDDLPRSIPGSNAASANSRYKYRSPIDLSNQRLRKLARALGPSYIRVSGTWRNSTYFQDNDEPQMETPPAGFQNVMTRSQWKGVIDFAHAVDAEIVSSVTTSAGVHDSNGVWTTKQAKAWLDYTKSVGGHIAAMEYMNEPNLMSLGGVGGGYGAPEFGRDSKIFGEFLRKESPGTLYLGVSSTAEGLPLPSPVMHLIPTSELFEATGPIFDGFSYHVYYTQSHRCVGKKGIDVNDLLSSEWFDRGLTVEKFYSALRDKYMPGKDIWLTETGEASCGGDKWASDFVDSFRLLDQFGSLAQKSVKSIMHNTLSASDYGLIDEETLQPRPNYWSALLWKRTMGTRSLDPGIQPTSGMRIYAQCLKNSDGGVALLVLNVDKETTSSLEIPFPGKRYTLSSPDLLSTKVMLNGSELKLGNDDAVPELQGQKVEAGNSSFAPETITFITLPTAGNAACRN